MRVNWGRVLVTAVVLAASAGVTGTAHAANNGEASSITTPTHDFFVTYTNAPVSFPVAGRATGLSSVDIDCVTYTPSGISLTQLATAVPVSGGSFGATAVVTGNPPPCRVRALPAGSSGLGYLGSFTGPVMRTRGLEPLKDGATMTGYVAVVEESASLAQFADVGDPGNTMLLGFTQPDQRMLGPGLSAFGALALPPVNLAGTASALRVDGHVAYLPAGVQAYLKGTRAIATVTSPALTATFHTAVNGDATITESAPLVRCSVNDTYPPTAATCPAVTPVGVTFSRTTTVFRGGQQLKIRDAFTDTAGVKHAVSAEYQGTPPSAPFGVAGLEYPGQTSFHSSTPSQQVTGLGTKANTVYLRSDITASSSDPQAYTVGLSWSRAPQRWAFSASSAYKYATPYALTVPAHGAARLGFALSGATLTATVAKLAALAVGDMMPAPRITSPVRNATVHGHAVTVKGTTSLGANGLPTSVTVNGHLAKISVVSSTSASYSFRLTGVPYGLRTITVVARDSAGNTRSASERIRLKA